MGARSRLPMLLQAAAALNVSVVPSYFRTQKERKFFRTYGKWQTEERRCDKFIRNRAYDKTCQQMDPKPYELLPLLVTGAPGSGTRAVFELVYAMCHKATRECRQYPEFNTTMVLAQRPAVLRRLHAIDARRLYETRSWVFFFSILSRFGPRRDGVVPRRTRRSSSSRTAARARPKGHHRSSSRTPAARCVMKGTATWLLFHQYMP